MMMRTTAMHGTLTPTATAITMSASTGTYQCCAVLSLWGHCIYDISIIIIVYCRVFNQGILIWMEEPSSWHETRIITIWFVAVKVNWLGTYSRWRDTGHRGNPLVSRHRKRFNGIKTLTYLLETAEKRVSVCNVMLLKGKSDIFHCEKVTSFL